MGGSSPLFGLLGAAGVLNAGRVGRDGVVGLEDGLDLEGNDSEGDAGIGDEGKS